MFNCKMTEEPTMATDEEASQRVYAKKLAADRESKKRKRPRNDKNSKKTGLRLIEKARTESVPRNHNISIYIKISCLSLFLSVR